MDKLLQYIFWMILLFILLPSQGLTQFPPHHFSAYIVQDGKRLYTHHHVIKVKRKPFDIVLDMPDKEGVFVNIAFFPNTFRDALENVRVDSLHGFKKNALPELWGNPKNELLVSDFSPYYWYIESVNKHKFSYFQHVNNRYICYRRVDVLYDIDVHKPRKLETLEMPLYLTFIKFRQDGDNMRAEELMRHEFKIEWID